MTGDRPRCSSRSARSKMVAPSLLWYYPALFAMFMLVFCTTTRAQRTSSSTTAVRKAHDFSTLVARGNIALKANEFAGANGQYREALDLREPWDSYTYIRASLAAYLSGDSVRAWPLLHRAIATGATLTELLDITSEYSEQAMSRFNGAYKSMAPSARREFACSVDLEVYTTIRDMVTADQCIRNMPRRTVRDTLYLQYMGKQDSIRFMELVSLVEDVGWPTFQKIGNLNSLLPLLLMHNIGVPYATDIQWALLRNAIQKEVANGNEDGYVLAMLEDISLRRSEQPQRYGTESDGWDSVPMYYTIDSCGTIDDRRRALGMIPLSLDAHKRGFQLPDCYSRSK